MAAGLAPGDEVPRADAAGFVGVVDPEVGLLGIGVEFLGDAAMWGFRWPENKEALMRAFGAGAEEALI